MHLVLFKYLYLQNYDSYKKYKNGFEIYIKFCFRTMYFYKKVEIDIFFKYSDFGQGESTLKEDSLDDEVSEMRKSDEKQGELFY